MERWKYEHSDRSWNKWEKKIMWLLPVMYMCDCRRPVAKDPGLDVHWSRFGVCYGHIYDPLQAFKFISCHGRKKKNHHTKCSLWRGDKRQIWCMLHFYWKRDPKLVPQTLRVTTEHQIIVKLELLGTVSIICLHEFYTTASWRLRLLKDGRNSVKFASQLQETWIAKDENMYETDDIPSPCITSVVI